MRVFFKHAVKNSFPELEQRIRFLNKFYQCHVAGKMPQKVRKLVTAGPKDSGKTSGASIFHRLIPAQAVPAITKEQQFSAAMINETTQIVMVDE
jgi:polynucleotide 5'-kinase involved in rRNA processing